MKKEEALTLADSIITQTIKIKELLEEERISADDDLLKMLKDIDGMVDDITFISNVGG